VQFVASAAVLAPLAWFVEGFGVAWEWPLLGAIVYLVIGSSILAFSALHILMRHGEATRVTSLMYLTPVFAVVLEFALFKVVPTVVSVLGIAITCAGVALVAWQRRPLMPAPE
jgi:drug/metabolite transporter (DMT)-like permease